MDSPAQLPMRLHVRRRPGMYLGGTNGRGLRVLLDDVVTEQLDAPGARPARVRCTIAEGGAYAVGVAGGALAAVEPGDFEPDADHFAHWPTDRFFSLAIASALSERLDAEVVRDGRRWTQTFAAGLPAGPRGVEEAVADGSTPLLRVRYRPDRTLFPAGEDAGFLPLCGRAQEWAAFHPHVRFTIENERDGQRRDYHYPDGLLSLAQEVEH